MGTYNIEFLAEVDSTNAYLRKKAAAQLLPAHYAVSTGVQLQGKGQRGNVWESTPHQNITASFAVKNVGALTELSWLNNAAALAVVNTLAQYGVAQASVKWPNDVYVGDRKVAGILTENILVNKEVTTAVVGVGLNVNQLKFGDYAATSIAAVTGIENDLVDVLHTLYDSFYAHANKTKEELLLAVNSRLYKKDADVTFEQDGRTTLYTVKYLLKNGNLAVSNGADWLEIEHHKTKWVK